MHMKSPINGHYFTWIPWKFHEFTIKSDENPMNCPSQPQLVSVTNPRSQRGAKATAATCSCWFSWDVHVIPLDSENIWVILMCILSGDLMVVFLGHFMGFNEILMSISRQISPGFNWDIYIYIYIYIIYIYIIIWDIWCIMMILAGS